MDANKTLFDNTNVDFSGLLSQAILRLDALSPKWTSKTPSDPGMALVELLALFTDVLKRYGDFAIQNNSLRDATLLKQIYTFSLLVGSSIRPKISASALLKFTAKAGLGSGNYPVYIPEGTQVQTSAGILFETASDIWIPESTLVATVMATEGQTYSSVALDEGSDGRAFQRLLLTDQSISFVNGAYQLSVEVQESGNYRVWTYVPSLVQGKSLDRIYTLEFADDGTYLLFGDGKTGMIPPPSAAGGIRATYRIGGGSRGIVEKNTLTILVDSALLSYVESVTNENKSYGAVDGDDIETARNNVPAYIKTNDRAIAPQDFKTLAERYGGIALARSFAIAQSIYLFVVPSTGGNLDSGLQTALQDYLLSVCQQGYVPQIMQALYKTIDLDIEIKAKRGWQTDTVKNAVLDNLTALLNPTSRSPVLLQETTVNNIQQSSLFINDFGADLHIDAIYTIIRNTPGVEYSNIKKLYVNGTEVSIADVAVQDFEIIRNGTINVELVKSVLDDYTPVFDPSKETQTI